MWRWTRAELTRVPDTNRGTYANDCERCRMKSAMIALEGRGWLCLDCYCKTMREMERIKIGKVDE